jgi:uncharacterized protein (UPF0261 family)
MRAIALIAALDTKGEEARFLQKEIEKRGHKSLVIDIGIIGKPQFEPGISRYQVARAAGSSIRRLIKAGNRAAAVETMAAGARSIVAKLHARRQLHGVVSPGGGQGTAIATTAMRALPLGVPKVMVSTIAARDTSPYLGTRDIVMMPSVVDMGGLNPILRQTLSQAAGAICGMVEANRTELHFQKPVIGMTMFGVTTPCVLRAKARIEQLGYETLLFHANGVGGRVMEELIENGKTAGVLDITTTELADELVGGVLSAGPKRLNAAGKLGIPQVVCPGALDMVNFNVRDSVPRKFRKRRFTQHRQGVTLMRTTKRENEKLGQLMAKKLNRARGPVVVAVPQKGFSAYDRKSGPFFDPDADRAFTRALERNLREEIQVMKIDAHINDERFAVEIASMLAEMLGTRKGLTTRYRGR